MEKIYYCRRECCPEMYYDRENDNIVIKDDFGKSITLSKKQFEDLKKSFEDFMEKKENK